MSAVIDAEALPKEEAPHQIFRVAIENIQALWPQIESLVAVELFGLPTHLPDDVRHILLANRANLWIQWSDRVEAMVITDFVSYPRGLALRIWLGAARKDAKFDRARFFVELQQWARRNECRWIDGCGRVGWLKVFPDVRYAGMFMRLDVDKDYMK